jgi:hypothetical protein
MDKPAAPNTGQPPATEPSTAVQPAVGESVQEVEFRLKRLEWWVKLCGIAAAVFGMAAAGVGVWNGFQQNKLFRAQEELSRSQAADMSEKRRVNLKVEMSAVPAFDDNSVMVSVTLTNNSTRLVHVAMTGVRIWKSTWESGDALIDHPELLVYSDTVVYDCPAGICQKRTQKSNLRGDYKLTLTPGESEQDGFGPYVIPAADRAKGVWVEAFARPVEKDDGVCVITGPPPFEGGFPAFCDDARVGQPNCDDESDCLFFNAAPFPFRPAGK